VFLVLHFNHDVVTVRVARVERQPIVNTVSTNGKVEPTRYFQAHAPGPGVVDKIFVTLGEHVESGQELVKMDDTEPLRDIAAARASIDSATSSLNDMQQGGTPDELIAQKADLSQARLQEQQDAANLSTLKKLQAQGAASANEVAQAQQQLADAQVHLNQLSSRRNGRYSPAEIAAQRAQLSQAKATLAAAQRGYANVDIRAPFSGTVYAIPASQYDFVQAGETMVDLADLSKLQIRAYFDEPEIGKLKAGEPVKIVWDARPEEAWHGHIIEAPTTVIAYGTRNVGECLISVDDANGDLLPNTNVTVSVTTLYRADVLSLPREALHTEGARDFVYKVVNGRLVQTPVQVGSAVNLTRFEIAGGLKEGDVVALGATTEVDLTNGLRVKVQP
jgi:HlyD family secretion protein